MSKNQKGVVLKFVGKCTESSGEYKARYFDSFIPVGGENNNVVLKNTDLSGENAQNDLVDVKLIGLIISDGVIISRNDAEPMDVFSIYDNPLQGVSQLRVGRDAIIEKKALEGIQAITRLEFGGSKIKEGAFANSGIISVILRDGVQIIKKDAFCNDIEGEHSSYSNVGGFVMRSHYKYEDAFERVFLPKSIVEIGQKAFYRLKPMVCAVVETKSVEALLLNSESNNIEPGKVFCMEEDLDIATHGVGYEGYCSLLVADREIFREALLDYWYNKHKGTLKVRCASTLSGSLSEYCEGPQDILFTVMEEKNSALIECINRLKAQRSSSDGGESKEEVGLTNPEDSEAFCKCLINCLTNVGVVANIVKEVRGGERIEPTVEEVRGRTEPTFFSDSLSWLASCCGRRGPKPQPVKKPVPAKLIGEAMRIVVENSLFSTLPQPSSIRKSTSPYVGGEGKGIDP